MLFLREPFWIVFLCAFIGILFGRMKGRPGWGFLLGLFFGPLGLALVLMLPARRAEAGHGHPRSADEARRGSGPACPRCSKSVSRGDKACPHCGNVLVPIRYEVRGPETAG
jgi:hypothetical protein